MQVEFQISKEDYIGFYKKQLNERFQKWTPIITIGFFFFLAAANGTDFNWINTALAVIGYFFVVYFLFNYFPLLIFNRTLKKLIATEPGYLEKKKWTIEEEGLRSESPSKNALWKWGAFTLAKGYEKYISLILVDKRFMLLPKNSFESDAEATNFLGIVQSRILKDKGYPNLIFDKSGNFIVKSKPPYLLGILCFVPIMGAFIGVALVLYGVFKYKNRLLILIGSSGIIVSIIVYGLFNYWDKHSSIFNAGLIEGNKATLNVLVKEIEFYKVQNGAYPDSLEQLNGDDKKEDLFDPLASDSKKSNKFYYKIIGNKYTIFSSGRDQTPYTKDDIYPTIKIDTNKMGLIFTQKHK